MSSVAIVIFFILIIAVTMSMVGRGGGNFYVLVLALAGIPMHQAATTGQFILFTAAVAAALIFHKNKAVAWPLAAFIGILVAIPAFAGGYFAYLFSGFSLKIIFSCLLALSGAMMLLPASNDMSRVGKSGIGYWYFKSADRIHAVDLWIAVPVTLLAGFSSGMVGVSGGSFLVPLMVLACGVPMHVAVGTASLLVAISALMGFAGHAIQGDFSPTLAIPLSIVTVLGGLIGSKFSMKTKPGYLKNLFAYTNWAAAIFMFVNALGIS